MPITVVQISDSHLFADKQALHCGVNVYHNFQRIIEQLSQITSLDAIVFTGDLTQDHSEDSYRLFQQTVIKARLTSPFYFLAGNHDSPELMLRLLSGKPFNNANAFSIANWRFVLLSSKSATPAGVIQHSELQRLKQENQTNDHLWCFMHHHPINVGYFIDRHPLTNANEFWQVAKQCSALKGVACGHVHRGQTLFTQSDALSCKDNQIPLLTCPATSIQFDPKADTVSALAKGPGYRLFTFEESGQWSSSLYHLPIEGVNT